MVNKFVRPGAWLTADGRTDGRADGQAKIARSTISAYVVGLLVTAV